MLSGSLGNDTLDGGSGGVDTLDGGAGNDRYLVRSLATTLVDASGTDEVIAFVSGVTLAAGIETLSLAEQAGVTAGYGGFGGDTLVGNTLDNDLRGGSGGDTLFGLGGADLLLGEGDNDRLFGGTGADLLAGQAGDDELQGEEDKTGCSAGQARIFWSARAAMMSCRARGK